MRLSTISFLSLIAVFSQAEPNRKLAAVKLTTPPKIDGIVEPAEWNGAAKADHFVHLSTGEKTAFEAQALVGYDSQNLYVAFFCPDPDPKLIRKTEYRRNVRPEGDDQVILIINPFNNHQQNEFNQFNVGAGGGMKAQFAGGRAGKREWEGAWDSKSRVTESGWECEIVIPWKILRLPAAGKRDIEINFARDIPRAHIPLSWCDIGPQERMENNGTLTGVEIPELKDEKTIQALPYQIVGYDQELGREVINTGLDIRYNVSSQVSSLVTINPDFQNIEGSVLNLAFSRFERLAEERRPFFVEGKQDFQMGGMFAQLFAPQRLGSLDLGAKVFGKLSDSQTFGGMFTTEFDHHSAAVGRFRQTWGEKSYMNAGLVHWDDKDNNLTNTAGDLEIIHFQGNWGADFIYNQTDDSEDGIGKRRDFDLMYQDSDIFVSVGHQEITEKFLPRIGFAPQTGFKGWNAFVFGSRSYGTGPITRSSFEMFGLKTDREDSNGTYLDSIHTQFSTVTRGALEIELSWDKSNFQGDLADLYSVDVQFPENNPYRYFNLSSTIGTVDNEDYSLYGVSGNYRFSNRITVTPRFQSEKVGNVTDTLAIIGLGYEIDRDRSIAARIVRREDSTNWYLAYRHSGNIGTEWYVIVGDPNAEEFQRKIIIKAVIPVNLKL
jgi:hypothetical protein